MANHNIAKKPGAFEYGPEEDFSTWYLQFNAYCTLCDVSAANKYTSFITFLNPRAFSLVHSLNLSTAQKEAMDNAATLALITDVLTVRKSNVPCRIQLQHSKQTADQTLSDFMYTLEKIAIQAYPGTDNSAIRATLVIDQFCIGVLNKDVSIELLKHAYKTIPDAVGDAQRFAAAYEIRNLGASEQGEQYRPVDVYHTDLRNRSDNNQYNSHQHNANSYRGRNNVGRGNVNRGNGNRRNNRPRPQHNQDNRTESSTPSGSRGSARCYTCQRTGHYANECKAHIECYNCHKMGHFSYECRSGRNHNNNQTTRQSNTAQNDSSSSGTQSTTTRDF